MIRLFIYLTARWHQLLDRFDHTPSLGEFDSEDVCGECDCFDCETGLCCDDCMCYDCCVGEDWQNEDDLKDCDCEMCIELSKEPRNDDGDDDDDDWNHQLRFTI